jgi:hypothetical protein
MSLGHSRGNENVCGQYVAIRSHTLPFPATVSKSFIQTQKQREDNHAASTIAAKIKGLLIAGVQVRRKIPL